MKFLPKAKIPRMILLMLCDVLIMAVVSYLGLLIRFDFFPNAIPDSFFHSALVYLPFYIVVTLGVFHLFRLYSYMWSLASIHEVFVIVAACALATILQIVGMSVLKLPIHRSYYLLCFMGLTLFTGLIRYSYRIQKTFRPASTGDLNEQIRVMIVGAGEAGLAILKETEDSNKSRGKVVCLIDDSINKKGLQIRGIPVVGNRYDIPNAVKDYKVDQIFVALPTAVPKERKEIIEICQGTSAQIKVLPGIFQLLNGEVTASKMRDVEIDDLLGRDPITINQCEIFDMIAGKTILVTGGGGSIGSELCRQIAQHAPNRLIVFDIYENNVYDLQQELIKELPNLNADYLIGSVRNEHRLDRVFETYRPDMVFHAAAHKHVPLMEMSPNEAIKNNVFGTYNTARMADKYGTDTFVLISTDKAVNPTNIMGASKRLCEMVIQMMSRHSKTKFVAVRFGNVLGSNGSVVQLFKKQIAQGGPLTVTHPDIIRYFMTIPEAVQLVLQAGAYAKGGEIFILDMGEPVKIMDLARNMIRLSGYTPDEDIKIKITGLRPGEKLYEEMLMKEEGLQDTANNKIHIGKPILFDDKVFIRNLEELQKTAEMDSEDIKKQVARMVPTYHPEKALVTSENVSDASHVQTVS